jgi:hypothetical protein
MQSIFSDDVSGGDATKPTVSYGDDHKWCSVYLEPRQTQ